MNPFPRLLLLLALLPIACAERGGDSGAGSGSEIRELNELPIEQLRVTLKATDPDKAKLLGLGSQFIQEKALTAKRSGAASAR